MVLSLFDDPRGSPADLARERFRLESSTQILSMTNNGLPMAVVTSTTQKRGAIQGRRDLLRQQGIPYCREG